MSKGQDWQREPNGFRLEYEGMNTVLTPDLLGPTKYPYGQNIRRYKQGRVTGRATQTAPVLSLASPAHSTRRLNDSTPAGPPAGFILVSGAGNGLFAGATLVDGGMSGKPISEVPFRPDQSVQPWMYVADANKMLKVRSDGTTYKMGIAEPQTAPGVVTNVAATIISFLGDVTVYYWGDSPHSGPVGQYIWRNGNDTGSSGPTRSTADAIAAGHVTTGSSLLFDESHVAPAGTLAQPMQWDILDDTGASLGTKSLFEPALESEGYADFNFVAQCSLYVPAPGTYVFQATYKDRIQWGIGNGQNGEVPTWSGKGTVRGTTNQTMTAIGGYPLLPAAASNDGGGYTGTSSISVTFPKAGIYPFELNYDYWFHSNRHCTVKVNGTNIPPITGDVFTDAQYRYRYRSAATGAKSNPSPASNAITLPVSSTDLTPVPSTDPQVDKVDWFRKDAILLDWTYVGTSPNAASPPFTDSLLDSEVSGNPLLEFDNFEPFPSIDLPRKGAVNVAAGAVDGTMQVSWVSGDQFNVRWLPGTIMVIGTVAYTLYNRPTSTTQLTVLLIGDMPTVLAGLVYEIAEPDLAAQPMSSMWGPTDNVNFMFACGDTLRPGVLYWTKGNNPDSAPDTNQQDVTSPSEPLMNGCIIGGIGMVFSTERAWLIYPNFFNALATVTGTVGSTWSLVESVAERGLFIRRCICTDGGKTAFFRAKDGIYESVGGNGSQSISDDLYNLFPHEGFTPKPITLAGFTVYPPDDTKPDAQQLNSANGYVYYDYEDTGGTPRTLVYDIGAKAWCVDEYQFQAITHALEEGPNVNGVLTGSVDGTVRPLVDGGAEVATCVLLSQCINAGDARANKRVGDLFFKGSVASAVNITPYQTQYGSALAGFSPIALAIGTPNQKYIVDFTDGLSRDIDDIEVVLSWAAGNSTILDLWQPNFIALPENIQDRPTDWTDGGFPGTKFVQGIRIEADTFGVNKVFKVQNGDDLSFVIPNETPCNFNGQSIQTFSFSPFLAHTMRVIATDGIPWRRWNVEYVFQPYPEECTEWTTELITYGAGWQHIRMLNIPYIATAPVTVILYFDQWPTITLTDILPASPFTTVPIKTKVQVPANKSKLMGFSLSSTQPFRPFKQMLEVVVGEWGRVGTYETVQPFGGPASDGAEA